MRSGAASLAHMHRSSARARRIGDQVQRELAELVRLELKDPRVGMITLTGVDLSTDYTHAKVFFTLLGSAQALHETERALEHAAGFLRTQLSHRLRLRHVPQLHFVFDASVERGMRLSKLIDDAVRPNSGPDDGGGA